MDVSYFYHVVLPLWIIAMVLAVLVYYYANREERARKKIVKLLFSHEESYAKELDRLAALRQEGTLDQTTYERMKHILDTNLEKTRSEAREMLASSREKQTST